MIHHRHLRRALIVETVHHGKRTTTLVVANNTVIAVDGEWKVRCIERTISKGSQIALDRVHARLSHWVPWERPKPTSHSWLVESCNDVSSEAEVLLTGYAQHSLNLLTWLAIQGERRLRLLVWSQVAIIQIMFASLTASVVVWLIL